METIKYHHILVSFSVANMSSDSVQVIFRSKLYKWYAESIKAFIPRDEFQALIKYVKTTALSE